jgi:hypothetical protein
MILSNQFSFSFPSLPNKWISILPCVHAEVWGMYVIDRTIRDSKGWHGLLPTRLIFTLVRPAARLCHGAWFASQVTPLPETHEGMVAVGG